MSKREIDPFLAELYKRKAKVYSISKCNVINNCLYEAYNSYILKTKGENNVYGILGSKIHNKLEDIVNGKSRENELKDALDEEIQDLDIFNYKFPKIKNDSELIKNNWIDNMSHFAKNFVCPKGNFETEKFFLYNLPCEKDEDRWVQGYIDLIRYNKDGTVSVIDWKTSADFKKKDLIHHGRQLVLYQIALEYLGFKVREVGWYMLKYCSISYQGKTKKITKVTERRNIVKTLKNQIEKDMSDNGYDDIDIEIYISKALQENNLNELPDDIAAKYVVSPYVRKYEVTEELKKECLNYINSSIDKFDELIKSETKDIPHIDFYYVNKSGKKTENVFYCSSLCGYRNTCKYIKEYNEQKELEKLKEEDKFEGLF